MKILPLHADLFDYLRRHGLEKKFLKQVDFLLVDLRHPNLNLELLVPHHLRFYSFRVDKKYRAIFIFRNSDTIEILDINNHYQ